MTVEWGERYGMSPDDLYRHIGEGDEIGFAAGEECVLLILPEGYGLYCFPPEIARKIAEELIAAAHDVGPDA